MKQTKTMKQTILLQSLMKLNSMELSYYVSISGIDYCLLFLHLLIANIVCPFILYRIVFLPNCVPTHFIILL